MRYLFHISRGAYRFSKVNATMWWWEYKNYTVARLFTKLVKAHPDKIAYIFEDKEWTYQDVRKIQLKFSCF